MKQKIKELIKSYKLKITEEEDEFIIVKIKKINLSIQIEEDYDCQIWISEIEGVDLPDIYYDGTLVYGDIDELESFIEAILNGEFNYIKELYTSLEKLQDKHGEDFDNMISYFS